MARPRAGHPSLPGRRTKAAPVAAPRRHRPPRLPLCSPRRNATGVEGVRRRELRIVRLDSAVFRSGGRPVYRKAGRPDHHSSVEVGVVGRSHPRFYWSNRVLMQRLAPLNATVGPPTLSPCVSLWPPPPARRSNRAYRPGPRPLCPESRRPPRPQTCARPRQLSPVFDWPDCPARRRSAACRVPRTPGSGGRRRPTARPRPAPAGASGPVSTGSWSRADIGTRCDRRCCSPIARATPTGTA